jgi:hypothetical protein
MATWTQALLSKLPLRPLLYVLSAIFVLGTAIWTYLVPDSQLAPNFVAEAVGLLVTVAIVDVIVRSQQRREARPGRFAAYLATQIIYNRTRGLWTAMLTDCLSQAPAGDEILLSDHYGQEIALHLNLDAISPSVIPSVLDPVCGLP